MPFSLVQLPILVVGMLLCSSASSALTVDEIREGLSEKRTEAQKDRFWEENEYAPIKVSGKVVNAEEGGVILPATVTMSVPGLKFEVQCWLRDLEGQKIFDVNIGDTVECSGIFMTYSEFFETITIDKATLSVR